MLPRDGQTDENENIIYVYFDDANIVASDVTFRTGAENEIIVDLGNGDIIRLQFERSPDLDLTDRTTPHPLFAGYELYYGGAVEFEFFDRSILYGPDILQLLDHNEAPIFSDGDFGATLDADTFSSLALAGEFSFDDADTADVIDISVASVSATGAIAGIPSNEALLGFIFTQVSRDDTADLDGQARWIFSADPGTFDYLADGEF